MTTQNRPTYGGQAVLEGVMIRGQTHMAVAVRRPNGAIATHLRPLSTLYTGALRRLPLVRGVVTLVETLSLGMRALSYSSSVSLEDPDADPDSEVESEELSKGALASMLLVSFSFAILLFFLLPLFASRPLEGVFGNDILSNVAEGAIRLAVFIAYIWVIGRMSEIRRVFMYHGAEHMTVHAQERGDPLEIDAIRRYSPAHPRCGTAFLLTVMVVAILVFVFVPREPLWWLITSRIVFIPLIAAVAYEVIRLSGRYEDNPLVSLISAPNLLLQKLTTRWPDDDQIEVAVAAMQTALDADKSTTAQPPKPAQSGQLSTRLQPQSNKNREFKELVMDADTHDIYEELVKVAKSSGITYYSEIAPLANLDMSSEVGRIRIAQILEEISNAEHRSGRPLLTAVVTLKGENLPGKGFFDLAKRLGKYDGGDDDLYWASELKRVHDYWT